MDLIFFLAPSLTHCFGESDVRSPAEMNLVATTMSDVQIGSGDGNENRLSVMLLTVGRCLVEDEQRWYFCGSSEFDRSSFDYLRSTK